MLADSTMKMGTMTPEFMHNLNESMDMDKLMMIKKEAEEGASEDEVAWKTVCFAQALFKKAGYDFDLTVRNIYSCREQALKARAAHLEDLLSGLFHVVLFNEDRLVKENILSAETLVVLKRLKLSYQ